MTRVPNIANWGVFATLRIFMLATAAAADSASTVRKKYSVFIYSEAEPHAMYAIYKQTLKLCVLQYWHFLDNILTEMLIATAWFCTLTH